MSGDYSYDFYDIGNELRMGAYDGGNNIDIINGLDLCFGITGKSVDGYYDYYNTQWFIDRDRPIIGMCYPYSGMGHTVTVCGYYANYERIIYSESLGSNADSYVYTTANSDGSFDMYNDGTYYTWQYSVTV